jgi:hypothetical protein
MHIIIFFFKFLCVLFIKSCISLWKKVHSTSGATIRLGLKYLIKSTTRTPKQQRVNQPGSGPIRLLGPDPGRQYVNRPGPGPTSSNKSGTGPGPKNLGLDGL